VLTEGSRGSQSLIVFPPALSPLHVGVQGPIPRASS
jgi:hypothetical protein